MALACAHGCRKLSQGCPRNILVRCEKAKKDSDAINEDMLTKLREYEEENKKLKDQLAKSDFPDSENLAPELKVRVDGFGMKRETLFGASSSKGSWLSESDVDFFTRGGPAEGADSGSNPEEEAVVRKRLIIGVALTVGLVAFSQIPTEQLDGSASRPLYEYLVPLIRSIALLEDLAVEVEEGRLASIPLVVDRILNKPNNIRKNLYSAIESVNASQRQPAREAVGNFVDLVQQADFNKYFDSVGQQSGTQMAIYAEFSLKSIRAAVAEGKNIVRLFPSEDVMNARQALVV